MSQFDETIARMRLRERMMMMNSTTIPTPFSREFRVTVGFDQFGFSPDVEALFDYLEGSMAGPFRMHVTTGTSEHPRDRRAHGVLNITTSCVEDDILLKLKLS